MKNFTQLSTHQLNDKIKEGVEAAMEGKLPEIVREAGEKEFLNSRQVKEVFNIPYRSQKHLRDTFQVPYTQYGKAIIYLRSEIVAWITTNKVRYKRIIERQDLDSNTIKTSKKAKQFNGQN